MSVHSVSHTGDRLIASLTYDTQLSDLTSPTQSNQIPKCYKMKSKAADVIPNMIKDSTEMKMF